MGRQHNSTDPQKRDNTIDCDNFRAICLSIEASKYTQKLLYKRKIEEKGSG